MSQNTVYKKPRQNKKYRFQLLHEWIVSHYDQRSVLDVAGGKGLLTLLLNRSGWSSTVVDPESDFRPLKYRDLETKKQIKVSKDAQQEIPRIKSVFYPDLVETFDLVVGMHAHGCNMQIIDACKKYNKHFLLLPCCVIGEPIEKEPNVDWFGSLLEYATKQGFKVKQDTLNFKGQNVLMYSVD